MSKKSKSKRSKSGATPLHLDAFKQLLDEAREVSALRRQRREDERNAGLDDSAQRIVNAMILHAQRELIESADGDLREKKIRLSETTLIGKARALLEIDDDDSTGYNIEKLPEYFSLAWNEKYSSVYFCMWSGGPGNRVYYFEDNAEVL